MNEDTKRSSVIIRILKIITKYTDAQHSITQLDICNIYRTMYKESIDRRTVSKCIDILIDEGYDIHKGRGLYYDSRGFTNTELRFLIDAVLSNKAINDAGSEELLNKISNLGGDHFDSHRKHIMSVASWNKTTSIHVLETIDELDTAIENKTPLKIEYSKYKMDKQLHVNMIFTISPYQMIIHNQKYYIICKTDKYDGISFLRIDRITKIAHPRNEKYIPIEAIKGYEYGIDYAELTSARPYMYSDQPQHIKVKCSAKMVDEIIDWFGMDVAISKKENSNEFIAVINSSPKAFVYWAIQFGNSVEVLAPNSVRQEIIENLKTTAKKYGLKLEE